MRLASLLVAFAALTFVSAAPVPEADANAAAGYAPDWKREAEAEADPWGRTASWKREAEAEAEADPWGRTASWKREAEAEAEAKPWGRTASWKREGTVDQYWRRPPVWKRDAEAEPWGRTASWKRDPEAEADAGVRPPSW